MSIVPSLATFLSLGVAKLEEGSAICLKILYGSMVDADPRFLVSDGVSVHKRGLF